ncbi:MAG: hypothetical protein K2Z81_11360 [Cyanobacteria bacterium]|nr:hypothetical protein [Cyanobacteriota bacterium]
MTTFDDQWGPCSKHSALQLADAREECECLPELSNRKNFCDSWMEDLLAEYDRESESGFSWSNESGQAVVIHWVNALYGNVQQYCDAFNRQLHDKNLMILEQEPAFHQVESAQEGLKVVYRRCFEAHFATRYKALVIRGQDRFLTAYIVPVEMLLGIALDSIHASELVPVLELELYDNERADVVSASECVSSASVDLSEVSVVARRLFCALLRAERRTSAV